MMKLLVLLKSFLHTLLYAVGQVFAWLNRREEKRDEEETRRRVSDAMQAAAKPNRENADRLNRWLARGRSGRLRSGRRGLPDEP